MLHIISDPSIGASIPKLHQLDLLEGNGKRVKLINSVAPIWDRVALRLHFEGCDIDQIMRDYPQQCAVASRTMFSDWLNGKGRRPTSWNTLIQALKEMGVELSKIATDLESILGTQCFIQVHGKGPHATCFPPHVPPHKNFMHFVHCFKKMAK